MLIKELQITYLCDQVDLAQDDQATKEWKDAVQDLVLKPAHLAVLAQRFFLHSLDLHSEGDLAMPTVSETPTSHQYYTTPIDGRADGRMTHLDHYLQVALKALAAQGVQLSQDKDRQAHIMTHFTNVKLHRIFSRAIVTFIEHHPSLVQAYQLPDHIIPKFALINPALRVSFYNVS